MQETSLVDALNHPTGPELMQLRALVERLMSAPRGIVAVRNEFHQWQVVRFYDGGRKAELRSKFLCVV